VRLPKESVNRTISDFLKEPIIRLAEERLAVVDLLELGKQSAYRKKLLDLERAPHREPRPNPPV
jgi:hypothetical protein